MRLQPGRLKGFSPLLAALAMVLGGQPVRAQWGVWTGDSLLAAGQLAAAESAYYAAVRASPRDPVARAALGKYLAARGAMRVGAVLLEEARFFGGDSAGIARALIPLYARLGDFKALDSLRPNVLTRAERSRAVWLRDKPPEASLRDSVIIVTYRVIADGEGFGTVILRIGRNELPAVIDPRISGLVVPSALRRDLRTFGAEGRNTLAVAQSVRLGGAEFSNVPTTIGTADEKVRIGFDVLAPYSPGFDPRKNLMTLRRAERRSAPAEGIHVPALFDTNGLRLLIGGRWHSSSAAMASMLLATRAWRWDARRGDVVLLTAN